MSLVSEDLPEDMKLTGNGLETEHDKKLAEEEKRKIYGKRRTYKGQNNPNYGKKPSEETKKIWLITMDLNQSKQKSSMKEH